MDALGGSGNRFHHRVKVAQKVCNQIENCQL